MGGHSWSLYEQNTQQSPRSGRRTVLHAGQSKKKTQASSGIVVVSRCPQEGQVMLATSGMRSSYGLRRFNVKNSADP